MSGLLKHVESELLKEKQRVLDLEEAERLARRRAEIEKDCAKEAAKISFAPPDVLTPRVLDTNEIEKVKEACWRVIGQDASVRAVLVVINDFVEFGRLLSMPENYIKTSIAQYVEKEVPSRTTRDMMDEMAAFELSRLLKNKAYAKVMQRAGEQIVYSGKIKTLRPPATSDQVYADNPSLDIELDAIYIGHIRYCRKREDIKREIRQRQERWLRPALKSGRSKTVKLVGRRHGTKAPPPSEEHPSEPEKQPLRKHHAPEPIVWPQDPPPWKRPRT